MATWTRQDTTPTQQQTGPTWTRKQADDRPEAKTFLEQRKQQQEDEDTQSFIGSLLSAGADIASDVWTGIKEAPKAVLGGFRDAAESVKELTQQAMEGALKGTANFETKTHTVVGGGPFGGSFMVLERPKPLEQAPPEHRLISPETEKKAVAAVKSIPDLPEVAQQKSITGQSIRYMAQFMAGFGPFGKALNAAKEVGLAADIAKGGKLAQAAKAVTAGALTDFAMFDAQQQKLGDLMAEVPGLKEVVPEFMKSSKNDTELTGRIKGALENAGLGAALEGFVGGLKILRAGTKTKEALDSATNAGISTKVDFNIEKQFKSDVSPTAVRDKDGNILTSMNAPKPPTPKAEASPILGPDGKPIMRPTQVSDIERAKAIQAEEAQAPKRPGTPEPAAQAGPSDYKKVQEKDIPHPESPDDYAGNIKLNKYNGPEEIRDELKSAAKANDDFMKARGVVSDVELQAKALAREMGGSIDYKKLTLGKLSADVWAERQALHAAAWDTHLKGKAALDGTPQALKDFHESYLRLVGIQERIAGVTAEAGRLLRQFRHQVSGDFNIRDLEGAMKQHGGDDVEKLAKMFATMDSPEKVAHLARKTFKATLSDQLLEAWMGVGLLSGFQTHAANILSNMGTALWTIPERAVAATISLFRPGEDKARYSEVLGQMYGLVTGVRDGLKAAAKAFATETPSGGEKLDIRRFQAIPSKVLREGQQKKSINILGKNIFVPFTGEVAIGGKQVRLSLRALMAEDEFFKAIGYAMEKNALAIRGGINKGLHGRELLDDVMTNIRNPSKESHEAAQNWAHYITFTQDLGEIGRHVQGLAKHPAIRLIMPFVKTPINIAKFGLARAPTALLTPTFWESMKAGGVSRDQALGRMFLGSAIGAAVAHLAANGYITGGGPRNRDHKSLLYSQGWKPYTIYPHGQKPGSIGISYSRLEPLGMVFGMAADYSEIAGHINEQDAGDLAGLITGAISKNLSSKTFLKGLSDAIEAFDDPQRYGQKWWSGYAGTLVPGVVAQYARSQDPILRQVNSTVDKLKSRIHGYSETLYPYRNVFGEIVTLSGGLGPDWISPIYTTTAKTHPAAQALLDAGYYPSHPAKTISDVKLDDKQFDFYQKTAGNMARDTIERFAKMPNWNAVPKVLRQKEYRQIFNRSREIARALTISKFPELMGKIRDAQAKKYGLVIAPKATWSRATNQPRP